MKIKRIILSLMVITVATAAVVAGTSAFFTDTEVSQDNVMVAGSIDLKIDHAKQTYNGIGCGNCDVEIVSDGDNVVTEEYQEEETCSSEWAFVSNEWRYPGWQPPECNGQCTWDWNKNPQGWYKETETCTTEAGYVPVASPYAAKVVPMGNYANDWETLTGSEWIWGVDGIPSGDDRSGFGFEKTFHWEGPAEEVILQLATAVDDELEVFILNGEGDFVKIHEVNPPAWNTVQNYNITAYLLQGSNTLRFRVRNTGGHYAGLLYKLVIEGNCDDQYFADLRATCELWEAKDLEEETFFNFGDIKPGDWGTNLISYRVVDNDAYGCMFVDPTPEDTALLGALDFFMWADDGDGVYENEEGVLYSTNKLGTTLTTIPLAEAGDAPILGMTTNYIGVAWCAGTLTSEEGTPVCDGSVMGNTYQNARMSADLWFYASQARHQGTGSANEFSCTDLIPSQLPENATELTR